jgi:hypothetical protein
MVGVGFIGRYVTRADGAWLHEASRPGPGWHRHDWKPRCLVALSDRGLLVRTILRRRWRLHGTTRTHLDRSPDEVGRRHVVLLVVLLKLGAWLTSDVGVHAYDELDPALEARGSRRTVQRWLHALLPDAVRLQQALRTAVVERFEPQPVERLFPGGLSPPDGIRRRRWKDPDKTYALATGLVFLIRGAEAGASSATVLLAEARRRLDGPLDIAAG